MQNGRIGRAHRMEDVPADDDHIGGQRRDLIGRALNRGFDIRLALIDTGRGEPLILTESQMEIGEVHQTHAG